MDQVIARARALLQTSQETKAMELLAPEVAKHQDNPRLLEVFGECLLEANDVESAYNVLEKAVSLDPEGTQGVDKFLYLGQIIGGSDGIGYVNIALGKLQDQLQKVVENSGSDDTVLVELAKLYPSSEDLAGHLIKKLNQGIFAEIEIWMTDLCMEPEAEEQCDKLISHSLSLDESNPEALSLLASIRISQQKNDEAREALLRSWDLFQERKAALEQEAKDAHDASLEYVELVQPLLGLARFAIELEMYEAAPSIAAAVSEINDNALDAFYYEALAHLLRAKQIYGEANPGSVPKDSDYREIELEEVKASTDENVQSSLHEARSGLTQGYRVLNSAAAEAMDPDVAGQVSELLTALGGPIMADLFPEKRNDDDDDDGWEDEIETGQTELKLRPDIEGAKVGPTKRSLEESEMINKRTKTEDYQESPNTDASSTESGSLSDDEREDGENKESREVIADLKKAKDEQKPELRKKGWRNTPFRRRPPQKKEESETKFTTDSVSSDKHRQFLSKYIR
ncbi:uncharacterized protein CXQ87_001622 [Candidozyma duobushaemuli]|uniref:Uncharacterized protein n=1 Tax=Candidozyma duobushaemuli TaxID=1231522 RepID=A0A2V1A4J8_9ASCO|nr:uncharacterized protein CXQ87_001622 [[Candida] duobushaemulonis]PVH13517.1 hypothetical protein CXQ87_001622 [[Candida] duobushaemulonis]